MGELKQLAEDDSTAVLAEGKSWCEFWQ